MPNLKFVALIVPEILGGPKIKKNGSRDPDMTTFDPIFHFFSLELTAVPLFEKFEVSSFNRSRDIRGKGPKIPKVGHVTPT